MLFNSFEFLIFLPIVFFIYWFVLGRKLHLQNILLLLASYVFYGWWDWRFLSLIAMSTVVDYLAGIKIASLINDKQRKYWLLVSVFFNLGLLAFFKYFNFFIDSWVDLMLSIGYEVKSLWTLKILLPVGISFYTFQTMSYTIDIYRNKLHPTKDFIAFAAFVSFFPQLVAGPIERATNLVPQFLSERKFSANNISYGFKLILWGFFMKLVVADRAGVYVDTVYGNIENHEGLTFIMATIFFAFQIYGDFAGYSLIAIGTAKWFGFDLMTNFRRPYFSKSVSEFWSRWHISLSTWFRDYVYIPLGGNRVSKSRWLLNLFITFVISGLWHGANWTFVIWGALNGIYLIAEVLIKRKTRFGLLAIIYTFIVINFSWIFFRSASVSEAFTIIKKIFTSPGRLFIGSGDDIAASIYTVMAIILLTLVELKREHWSEQWSLERSNLKLMKYSFYALVVFTILYLGVFGESQFIYFQF